MGTLREFLQEADARIVVSTDAIRINLDPERLAATLGTSIADSEPKASIEIRLPAMLKRRGHELRLVHAAADARPTNRDDQLIKLLASGRAAYASLQAGDGEGSATRRSHLVRLARLAFLAPDIITAIIEGRQPVEMTSRSLLRISDLPLGWIEQRKALGFI